MTFKFILIEFNNPCGFIDKRIGVTFSAVKKKKTIKRKAFRNVCDIIPKDTPC